MTVRLYYDDSSLTTFDAVVLACSPAGDRFDVRLDRTAFYPTSGGQPFDTGLLGGVPVVDVIDRGDEGIAHIVVSGIEPGTPVRGQVDGVRRGDHRQQHTGQHLLSAVFARLAGIETVGFHMGSDVSTIDLDREVTPDEIEAVEVDVNRLVDADVPVSVRTVAAADVPGLELRRPPKKTGALRIVEIEGIDRSACGGTHVTRTGAIGPVGIVGTEKVRGGTRLSFVCGQRAVRTYRAGHDRLVEVARVLGVAPGDVGRQVARLVETNRQLVRSMKAMGDELAVLRAPVWRSEATVVGDWRLVARHVPGGATDAMKTLAQAVVAEPGIVAVLVGDGDPAPVVVARAADVDLDAGAVVKKLVASLGGRGGGRADLAQGGVSAEPAAVLAAVSAALERLSPLFHGGRPDAGPTIG